MRHGCLGPLTHVGAVGRGWACVGTTLPALCSWYFSGISRTQAQQLLLSPANAPGAFLIRPSESSHGDFSLSGRRPPAEDCPWPGGCFPGHANPQPTWGLTVWVPLQVCPRTHSFTHAWASLPCITRPCAHPP